MRGIKILVALCYLLMLQLSALQASETLAQTPSLPRPDTSLPTILLSPIPPSKVAVYFSIGEASLSETAKSTLKEQARILIQFPAETADVVGGADTREVASEEARIGLGYSRAAAVRDFLVLEGISPDRLRLRSRAYAAAILLNETDEALARLRQVTTEVAATPLK